MHDHLGLRKRSSNGLRFGCWFDFVLTALFSEVPNAQFSETIV